MRSPWLRVGPKPSDKWPHGRRKTEKETQRHGEAGRGGGVDGSGAAGAAGACGGREGPSPRALLPEVPAETGAPRGRWDSGPWQSGRSGAAAALPPSGPSATPTVTPGQAAPGSGSCRRRPHGTPQLRKTTFPLWPPSPPPKKRGNWNRDGDPACRQVRLFSDQKGGLELWSPSSPDSPARPWSPADT